MRPPKERPAEDRAEGPREDGAERPRPPQGEPAFTSLSPRSVGGLASETRQADPLAEDEPDHDEEQPQGPGLVYTPWRKSAAWPPDSSPSEPGSPGKQPRTRGPGRGCRAAPPAGDAAATSASQPNVRTSAAMFAARRQGLSRGPEPQPGEPLAEDRERWPVRRDRGNTADLLLDVLSGRPPCRPRAASTRSSTLRRFGSLASTTSHRERVELKVARAFTTFIDGTRTWSIRFYMIRWQTNPSTLAYQEQPPLRFPANQTSIAQATFDCGSAHRHSRMPKTMNLNRLELR